MEIGKRVKFEVEVSLGNFRHSQRNSVRLLVSQSIEDLVSETVWDMIFFRVWAEITNWTDGNRW